MNFHEQYKRYKTLIDRRLVAAVPRRDPRSVYEPIRYILRAGGKRVRPVLTLLACESVGGRIRQALDVAVAVEILHTFTLVHDDIMDNAETRRGRSTIHRKWDPNTAILAGDEMVALAYHSLLGARSGRATELMETFTKAFTEVCEGQGLDGEIALHRNVGLRTYMNMIRKKTAALIAASTTLGGIAGGGSVREISALRRYGQNLGRAFQIQDDLLDLVADARLLGKTIGGDLKEGKRTYLVIKGLERAKGVERTLLMKALVQRKGTKRDIETMKTVLERNGVLAEAREAVARNTHAAQRALEALRPGRARTMFLRLAEELVDRTF